MAAPEEMSREELIALVAGQAARIAEQDARIAELAAANEESAARLARLEHLLSRNSGNSSMPPSQDDAPGRVAPVKPKRRSGSGRKRGKQPGAPGTHLAWTDGPAERVDRFPQGRCGCGAELAGAADLGIVDRYQQHEIPAIEVRITQYDQHRVMCGCGRVHTATRPDGARSGPVGYGPNLQALAVYLMVVQFIPAHRVVELLDSLTGAAPSVGFVHGMLARASALLAEVDKRIRALITLAYAVCCDETPLRVGPRTPKLGRKKAEKYLLVACTEWCTSYLVGDRDLDTFKRSVITELDGAVLVHDRYQNYDSAALGDHTHQLCCQHLGRDLGDAGEVYPDAEWPPQVARALRSLIHQANLARAAGADGIDPAVRDNLVGEFKHGVLVGLSETTSGGDRPGERKARLLLETLRDREADTLRFAFDLRVPPTSNQAERDLRPAKIQQNISGRLTSEKRTEDRYRIRGYLSTAAKHGRNTFGALREAIIGQPWMPPDPAPA
ncbi:IS66 family transposase [Candidatus Mycobacterium methanotrophicum]|uniref:IS66 family transposase n=1 Tax=Candidatus Mycobacterium methanotrophicum TaxID=2943498 RepID=A0ABY4QLZ6_9MYCO|nr:IS66 family transposase [Candidatus Mycobacterium methanotrophicum]UQX10297.1 IS66 family transposase [Candidatus Mycobacterium methanotrophicum]UQX10503.1 IS66 family transposase [Candidatus Mycobacterium methanotrophicum]UQX11894.1 IS66 family transposase [Candidatus Mycobacterium methanotrophicum]